MIWILHFCLFSSLLPSLNDELFRGQAGYLSSPYPRAKSKDCSWMFPYLLYPFINSFQWLQINLKTGVPWKMHCSVKCQNWVVRYSFIFLRTTNFIINFSYKKGPLNYFIFQILLTASAVIQSLETSKYGKTWKPLILHIFGSQVCILEYDTLNRGMQVFLMISNKTVDDLHF